MSHPTADARGALDVFTATPAEIRRAALDAVARALGPVGLARFLQIYEGGQGDYTAERDALVGTPTVDELFDALAPAPAVHRPTHLPRTRSAPMAKNGRTVSQRPDGTWANKKDGAERASSLHTTQRDAAKAAREQLKSSGGGELKVKGEDGKIRNKDTIAPARDPYPPKG